MIERNMDCACKDVNTVKSTVCRRSSSARELIQVKRLEIYDIMLEYFITESDSDPDSDLVPCRIYGIEIVKKAGNTVEAKRIMDFSHCRECTQSMVKILARNTVTPITLPYILDDMIGT